MESSLQSNEPIELDGYIFTNPAISAGYVKKEVIDLEMNEMEDQSVEVVDVEATPIDVEAYAPSGQFWNHDQQESGRETANQITGENFVDMTIGNEPNNIIDFGIHSSQHPILIESDMMPPVSSSVWERIVAARFRASELSRRRRAREEVDCEAENIPGFHQSGSTSFDQVESLMPSSQGFNANDDQLFWPSDGWGPPETNYPNKRVRQTPKEPQPWEIPESVLQEVIEMGWEARFIKIDKRGAYRSGVKQRAQGLDELPAQGNSMVEVLNTENLYASNVFECFETNQGRLEQPEFSTPNPRKAQAIKEMMASMSQTDKEVTKRDWKEIGTALRTFDKNVRTHGTKEWKPRGMESPLTHAQLIGAGFMRRQEQRIRYAAENGPGGNRPYGGIMADDMGMGKTIMTIANIIDGNSKKGYRTTLIVCPTSILNQWEEELAKHANESILGRVMRYHGTSKPKSSNDMELLADQGVVITTYAVVARSFPRGEPPEEVQFADRPKWWADFYMENRGILHSMKFHRIILDEAQAIKNVTSITSIACRTLTADFRWVLSGTPIMNRLDEIWPTLAFLRVPLIGDFVNFRRNFTSGKGNANKRLQTVLSDCMCRRTHNDTLFGSKILALPKPTQETHICELSRFTKECYRLIGNLFIGRVNRYSKNGELKLQYKSVLAMLLRLRQLCVHPLLIKNTFSDLDKSDRNQLIAVLDESEQLGSMNVAVASAWRQWLTNLEYSESSFSLPISSIDTGISVESSGNPLSEEEFAQKLIQHMEHFETPTCAKCRKPPRDAKMLPCHHQYCIKCLHDMLMSNHRYCIECGKHFDTVAIFSGARDDSGLQPTDKQTGKKSKKKPKDLKLHPIMAEIDKGGHMLMSAKVSEVKKLILQWIQENPNVKCIIYTLFNPIIAILSAVCDKEKLAYHHFYGGMSADYRSSIIKKFEAHSGACVLIANMGCGSEGLNLAVASRMIICDHWWNTAREQQAFCRMYRRGQTSETTLVRLSTLKTVDEEMTIMQERKDKQVGSAMDGKARYSRLSDCTETELMGCFGRVYMGPDGNFLIALNEEETPLDWPEGTDGTY